MAKGNMEELSLVKAAAWAWYQHGSGCDGRSMREFEVGKPQLPPKPSRYKLEAMRKVADRLERSSSLPSSCWSPERSSTLSLSQSRTDMSLLDAYEIERISRQLDRILESKGVSSRRAYVVVEGRDRPRGKPSSKREMMGGGMANGFLARHAVGICNAGGGVVEARVLGGRPRARRNSGSSVRLTHCRP